METLINWLIKIFGYLSPHLIRRIYKPAKFSDGIRVRIRGYGDGIAFNCGEIPNVRIWLEVTNLTPYKIEIDRIYGTLMYGSTLGPVHSLRVVQIPPAQEKEVLIEVYLNNLQREHIARNMNKHEPMLEFSAHIRSWLYNLEVSKLLKSNNVRFLNCP